MRNNEVLLVAIVAGLAVVSVFLWQFKGVEVKEIESAIIEEEKSENVVEKGSDFWNKLWIQEEKDAKKTIFSWIFTLHRRFYDSFWISPRRSKSKTRIIDNTNDEVREKRASSLVTYFCILVLILSLIRAALDMTSNLKKESRLLFPELTKCLSLCTVILLVFALIIPKTLWLIRMTCNCVLKQKLEEEADTFVIDSRRCSLHDFKVAQNILKRRASNQMKKAALQRQATVDAAHPLIRARQKSFEPVVNESLEKLNKIPEAGTFENTPKKSRFSTTPPLLRRCSVPVGMMPCPGARRSSIELYNEGDELNRSPETRRRMRMIYRH